jgi:DNA-binding FadR family transcriptional regulator
MAARSRGGDPGPKGAERLSARILDEIADAGWPVGSLVGTEPELVERYGVSRNTFREAVRLLEHLGAARMNVGRTGGLVVTSPDPAPVTRAAAVLLRYEGVDHSELHEARASVELAIVELAIARLDDDGAERLLGVVEREVRPESGDRRERTGELHMALAELAGNRALALFLDSLISLSVEYARTVEGVAPRAWSMDETHRAHGAIARAVVSRDVDTARRHTAAHLRAISEWMRGVEAHVEVAQR